MKIQMVHSFILCVQTQLFEGLEDEDFSFGDDTFVPRKSVKKLVLRKGVGNKSTSGSTSVYSDPGGDLTQQAGLDHSRNNQSPLEVLSITRYAAVFFSCSANRK